MLYVLANLAIITLPILLGWSVPILTTVPTLTRNAEHPTEETVSIVECTSTTVNTHSDLTCILIGTWSQGYILGLQLWRSPNSLHCLCIHPRPAVSPPVCDFCTSSLYSWHLSGHP